MRDFLVSIGSNRRLTAGMLLAEFKMPWRDLAETSTRARALGAGEVNLSSNSELWSILKVVRTHFAPPVGGQGGESLAKNSACPPEVLTKAGTEILNFDNFKFF